ncbi:MAG: hypothetical protein WCO66_02390 [Candidatus Absconditabacteria bacterium]
MTLGTIDSIDEISYMEAERTEKEIQQGQNIKRILSPHIVDEGTFVTTDSGHADLEHKYPEKKYHVIDTSAEALKNVMSPNHWLSGYYGEQFLWMTDAIDKEFRPLIAIIESFDVPKMQDKWPNACISGIQKALNYAKSTQMSNMGTFLTQLKTYFVHLSQANKNTEYFVPEIQKAIGYIDFLLGDTPHDQLENLDFSDKKYSSHEYLLYQYTQTDTSFYEDLDDQENEIYSRVVHDWKSLFDKNKRIAKRILVDALSVYMTSVSTEAFNFVDLVSFVYQMKPEYLLKLEEAIRPCIERLSILQELVSSRFGYTKEFFSYPYEGSHYTSELFFRKNRHDFAEHIHFADLNLETADDFLAFGAWDSRFFERLQFTLKRIPPLSSRYGTRRDIYTLFLAETRDKIDTSAGVNSYNDSYSWAELGSYKLDHQE